MIRDPSLPATLTFLHLSPLPQSYTGQTGGSGGGGSGTAGGNGPRDEDYEIPPITPPNHPEPPPLHLMEHDSTGYLCHSLPHNGLINPYSYPELPTLMMSNMLAQESHLVSNQMPSVSGRLAPHFSNYQPTVRKRPQKVDADFKRKPSVIVHLLPCQLWHTAQGLVGKSISVIPALTAHIGQSVKPSDADTR